MNFLIFRRKHLQFSHLFLLPELFNSLKVDKICFTGDFTTTSLREEFIKAKNFSQTFSQPFLSLPGNHDVYTKAAEKNRTYYLFFPEKKGLLGFSLKKDRIYSEKIGHWYWIGLDCAVATPPFRAYGIFTEEMGEKLDQLLHHIPTHHYVILGNHFPLFPSQSKHHDLKNSLLLRDILKKHFPKIKLYLHGHIHKAAIYNKCPDGFPLIVNSGCSAYIQNGGFYLIDIKETQCDIAHYLFNKDKGWVPEKYYHYDY